MAAADLDGDGRTDIVAANAGCRPTGGSGGAGVSVLIQSPASRGQFSVGGVYGGPGLCCFLAVGDVNGDGLNDVVLNAGPSALLQRTAAPGTFEPLRPLR